MNKKNNNNWVELIIEIIENKINFFINVIILLICIFISL